MNDREEIDQYLAMWDKARDSFPKEDRPSPSRDNKGVFYGFTHNIDPTVQENGPDEEEADHWHNVYYRALELTGEEEMLTEAEEKPKKKKPKKKKEDVRKPKDGEDAPETDDEEDGFGKDLSGGPGKNVKFNVNPTHFASKGADNKLRVTPNWTDGDELRELARLKAMMYDLESEMLGTDIRGGDVEPIRVRLVKIQKQCESLSQRLIPDPKTDVS
jgi:hypothetical protein